MGSSQWIDNVYELGLLGWGFDRCARLLDMLPSEVYLTNRVRLGRAAVVSPDFTPEHLWLLIDRQVEVNGPFPYGRLATPP